MVCWAALRNISKVSQQASQRIVIWCVDVCRLCSFKIFFTAVMVTHGFALPLKLYFMWQYDRNEWMMNNNTMSNCAVFTPEYHVQHQEGAVGWNTCRPSDWSFHSCLHQKNHHSLALHYSEGTGWCSALDRQRGSLTHSDFHVLNITPTDRECTVQAVVHETCQFLCRWSSLRSNQAPDTVCLLLDMPASPTVSQCTLCHQTVRASPSIWNGTKPNELKHKLALALTQYVHSLVHIDPYKNTYTLHYVHSGTAKTI